MVLVISRVRNWTILLYKWKHLNLQLVFEYVLIISFYKRYDMTRLQSRIFDNWPVSGGWWAGRNEMKKFFFVSRAEFRALQKTLTWWMIESSREEMPLPYMHCSFNCRISIHKNHHCRPMFEPLKRIHSATHFFIIIFQVGSVTVRKVMNNN